MEVCSSTEMGAPGASHLGTGDHGPKTDRSRPRSVPVNAFSTSNFSPRGRNVRFEHLELAVGASGPTTGASFSILKA